MIYFFATQLILLSPFSLLETFLLALLRASKRTAVRISGNKQPLKRRHFFRRQHIRFSKITSKPFFSGKILHLASISLFHLSLFFLIFSQFPSLCLNLFLSLFVPSFSPFSLSPLMDNFWGSTVYKIIFLQISLAFFSDMRLLYDFLCQKL